MKRKSKAQVDNHVDPKRFCIQEDSNSPPKDAQDVAEDNLCASCVKIDFDTILKTKVDARDGMFIQSLGSPSKISSCPLCVFFATVREAQDTDPELSATTTTGDCHLRAFSAVDTLGILGENEDLVDDALFLSVLGGGTSLESRARLDISWKVKRQLHPIVYATAPQDGVFGAFCGRQLRSSSANLRLVSEWIEFCRKHHGNRCRAPRTGLVRGFKLIDCKARRIVDASTRTPYIALSYVWGSGNADQRSAFSRFLPDRCEAVIEDAIAVVKELGMRYLWIDRYCIDQGNAKTKHQQIANMDSIYADAELVILAAAGDNPTYGLPGVQGRTRNPQPSVKLGGKLLISALGDPVQLLEKSKWMTRGWTYQEGLLARRQLAFTDDQLSFQCNGMRCVESLDFPLTQLHSDGVMVESVKYCSLFKSIGRSSKAFNWLRPHKLSNDYLSYFADSVRMVFDHLNEYNQRELTYDVDALNAFLGVLRAYEKSPTSASQPLMIHIYGVPIDTLDEWPKCVAEGFLWNIYQWKKLERRIDFPSWSWVGWKGWGKCTKDWRWQISSTDVNIAVELSDGTLFTFSDKRKLSLCPPECSKFIHITAWMTVFRLCKQDFVNENSSALSDVPRYWSIQEPIVNDSIFDFFRMLRSPDDPGDIDCVGVLMGWDKRTAYDREHELDAKFLLVERKNDYFERVGLCSYQSPSALKLNGETAATLGELTLQRQMIRLG